MQLNRLVVVFLPTEIPSNKALSNTMMAPSLLEFNVLDSLCNFFLVAFADVNECKENLFCKCKNCACENTWGSYECSCGGSNMLYIREHDTCISESSSLKPFWNLLWCSSYQRICSLNLNTLKVDRQYVSNSSNVKLFLAWMLQANTLPRQWAGASYGLFSLALPWLEQERMPCTNIGYG